MAEMSLTSSGTKKVLSFEEFVSAQAGGMQFDDEPTITPEVGADAQADEPIAPEMDGEVPTDDNQDDVTLLDGPAADADITIDEPSTEPTDDAPVADDTADQPTA